MKTKRISIALLFSVNGFLYANWAARLPELKDYFGIDNTTLGTLLLVMALGAVTAMPFTGWVSIKYGGHKMTWLTASVFCCLIPFIALSQNILILGVVLFILGMFSGAMDVLMNEQAILLERDWHKPIMSSFHATFSIGMAIGAFSGALFAKLNTAFIIHFSMVAILGFITVQFASRHLIEIIKSGKKEKLSTFLLPKKAVILLGIIAFCGMTGEGAMVEWSALFMNKVVGKSESASAVAFGVFGVAMTVGRIFGDHFTLILGKKKLLIYDSLLAIFGLGTALFFATFWTTIMGFFMAGIGLSTIVPLIYSSAGNLKGIKPSVGIAMATTIGYAGFFIGPPIIGFLSDSHGLRLGMSFPLFLFILMFILVFYRKI